MHKIISQNRFERIFVLSSINLHTKPVLRSSSATFQSIHGAQSFSLLDDVGSHSNKSITLAEFCERNKFQFNRGVPGKKKSPKGSQTGEENQDRRRASGKPLPKPLSL